MNGAPEPEADADSPVRARRAALFAGARAALGAPGLVLCASYTGFGSLVQRLGLDLGFGLLSTVTTWAMPSQLVLVELYAVGASFAVLFLAVTLTAVRLMPMVMTLLPLLGERGRPRWQDYVVAHGTFTTSWAWSMARLPALPQHERLPYFAGLSAACLAAACTGTAIGFFAAERLPAPVSLGLVFASPLFFLLVMLADLRQRARRLAVFAGLALGLGLDFLPSSWALLAAGVIAGTFAFAVDRALKPSATGRV